MKRNINYIKLIFLLLVFCITSEPLKAQTNINYPVNINPVIYPPYPTSVKYLNTATMPIMYLTINNKSSNATIVNALLSISIKTNDFTAQTKSLTSAFPISLIGNTPVRLSNIDISSLFSFSNLSGITLAQYNNTFPQSIITFGFVLYDAVTRRQISQLTNYSITFVVNSPPTTTAPIDKSIQTEQGIQNLLFQWQPRQAVASNGVQYTIQIVQLLNDTQDPQTAFLNTRVFFTDSTTSTTYNYNSKNPPLLSDKTYAWRIQAKANDNGGFTNATFSNNGYSNISSFIYSAPCKSPTQVSSSNIDTGNATISWTSITTNSQSYKLSYHKKADASWVDVSIPANNSTYTINRLTSATNYEVKITGVCYAGITAVSDIYSFKTTSKITPTAAQSFTTVNASCGQTPPVKRLNETSLLSTLNENDIITAGDFSIKVSGVTGGSGTFSGSGVVELWMAGHTFNSNVRFTNIKINSNKEVIDGSIALSNN